MSEQAATNRILVATVGTGRERGDIAHAITFSVMRNQATHVLLLCSTKTAAETLPLVLKALPQQVVHRELVCPAGDEDDVQRLVVAWSRQVREAIAAWPPALLIADFTSGTKAMSSALTVWAVQYEEPVQLSYVTGPRDQTGRATASTDVVAFCPTLIYARRTLTRAMEFFAATDFAAAKALAAPLLKIEALPDDALRCQARRLHYLAAAWEAWDRFDWKDAFSQFHHLARDLANWGTDQEQAHLRTQQKLLGQLKTCAAGKQYSDVLVADLLANTQRCMQRGQYDNAMARLYRGTEMLAQKLLWETHQIDTGAVDVNKLPAALQSEYSPRKGRSHGQKRDLGLREAWELFTRLEPSHAAAVYFKKVYDTTTTMPRGDLANCLTNRNQSLLAHGTSPVSEAACRRLQKMVEQLAELACSPGAVAKLIGEMRPVCPSA